MHDLVKEIKKVKSSIIAIGFSPVLNQITIIGSGFAVGHDGNILTSAHLYNQAPPAHKDSLLGMIMTKAEEDGVEHYAWQPLKFIKKSDEDDIALFQFANSTTPLLKGLEIDDSNTLEIGEDVYFIGFPYAAQLINSGFGITLIVNRGIVSTVKVGPNRKRNWFIVDAISNPGNSGCPLIRFDTNKVIGIMAISFRTQSQVQKDLDIREPMHICAAKPINLAKALL